MEPQVFKLTMIDNIIDMVSAILFLAVMAQCFFILYKAKKNEKEQYRLVLAVMLIVASSLFVFQFGYQAVFLTNAPLRVWDFYNYLTAIIFLSGAYRIAKEEGHVLSDDHPSLKKTGIL